jgi:hypothetical protein
MTLRSDHIAGAAFAGFGILIFALSGDLPFGRLSFPQAGFMPKLIAALLVLFGLLLVLRATRESTPLADIDWADFRHGAPVIVITGVAVALYTWFGFVITMLLMVFVLLVAVERKNPVRAAVYSGLLVLIAFNLFNTFLRAQMPSGPLDPYVRVPLHWLKVI